MSASKINKKKCNHYWHHPHTVWEGRTPSEVAVARYCDICGKTEMAFANKWQKALLSYPDLIKECRK